MLKLMAPNQQLPPHNPFAPQPINAQQYSTHQFSKQTVQRVSSPIYQLNEGGRLF